MRKILISLLLCLCLLPAASKAQSPMVIIYDDNPAWGSRLEVNFSNGAFALYDKLNTLRFAGLAALIRGDDGTVEYFLSLPNGGRLHFRVTPDGRGTARLIENPDPFSSIILQVSDTKPGNPPPGTPPPPIPPVCVECVPATVFCIVDEATGNAFTLNTVTKEYTLCVGGETVTGIADAVESRTGSNSVNFTHVAKKRNIKGEVHLGTHSGFVSGSVNWVPFTFRDRDVRDGGCEGCQQ